MAIGLCVALAVGASPAQAHTDLRTSTPASGARVDTAPAELRLRFTEDISPEFAQLALIRGDEPVQRLKVNVHGPVITAGVPPASPSGDGQVAWEVSYRVVSADGHPITGTVEFAAPMGPAPPPSPATPSPSEAPEAETDEAVGGDSETEGAAGSADQRDTDDSGSSSPSVITIIALALAVTAAAIVVPLRRRSARPR